MLPAEFDNLLFRAMIQDKRRVTDATHAWSTMKWLGNFSEVVDGKLIQHVDEYGGEGLGSDYWVVASVTHEDGTSQYFKREGYYQSFAYDYDDILDGETYEVYPRDVTITEYKKVTE